MMKSFTATMTALALLAVAVPATSAANFADANAAYILEVAGYNTMPNEMVTVDYNGQLIEMPAADAVRLAAELTSRMDLRNLGANALAGTAAAGDIGFFGIGCTRMVASNVAQPLFVPAHLQLWVYPGRADNVLDCGFVYTVEWTTKMVQFFDSVRPATVAGSGTVISFWGLTFGAIDGTVVKA